MYVYPYGLLRRPPFDSERESVFLFLKRLCIELQAKRTICLFASYVIIGVGLTTTTPTI